MCPLCLHGIEYWHKDALIVEEGHGLAFTTLTDTYGAEPLADNNKYRSSLV